MNRPLEFHSNRPPDSSNACSKIIVSSQAFVFAGFPSPLVSLFERPLRRRSYSTVRREIAPLRSALSSSFSPSSCPPRPRSARFMILVATYPMDTRIRGNVCITFRSIGSLKIRAVESVERHRWRGNKIDCLLETPRYFFRSH